MPSLNAAFVDVGYEKDAFLHYLDLGPQVQSLLKLTKQVRSGGYQSKLLIILSWKLILIKGAKSLMYYQKASLYRYK
jgi:ribonuclease G